MGVPLTRFPVFRLGKLYLVLYNSDKNDEDNTYSIIMSLVLEVVLAEETRQRTGNFVAEHLLQVHQSVVDLLDLFGRRTSAVRVWLLATSRLLSLYFLFIKLMRS